MKNLDAWTAHIKDPKDRNKFAEYVRNSTDLLGRLTEIIDMKLTIAKDQLRLTTSLPAGPIDKQTRTGLSGLWKTFVN